jgi:catechol 2,3-dioxygenase-like lactoylglutathione lyase family enzyme
MRIGHLELFVSDPQRSRAFYEDVLGFEVETVQAGGSFVWLKLGESSLLLRPERDSPEAAAYRNAACAIVLYTDDLPARMEELRGRGLAFRGTDGSPGCPTFTDPDGNWFQLVDPAGH